MLIQHNYYEELCVLAAAGQLTAQEQKVLAEHTEGCDQCRSRLADFGQIVAQVFPEYRASGREPGPPPGMTARFIARARTEGIALADSNDQWSIRKWVPYFRLAAECACAVLVFVLGLKILMLRGAAGSVAREGGKSSARVPPPKGDDMGNEEPRGENPDKANPLAIEIASKQKDLEAARLRLVQVNGRVAKLEEQVMGLRQNVSDRDAQIARMQSGQDALHEDLQNLRLAKASDAAQLEKDESELNGLHEKVVSLTAEINQNQQLSAAAEQAKDLIVARNLHIIDVHDNGPNEGRPHPFGRIFYAEHQKLIFYAYDLGDSRRNAKVSFCVWGEKSGSGQQAKHLGILHADDARDGRWVVTFDDREVLAQINTVFVTAEAAKKDITRPSGNRILVAFLGGEPNHP